jgi:murein DD-endopeptidase MepM/ murein hydrolase activator NlpD
VKSSLKFSIVKLMQIFGRITSTCNACFVIIGLLLLITASACAPTPQAIPAKQPAPPTAAAVPTQTQVPTLTASLSTATQTSVPTPAPMVCSPLAIQPINKLNTIVTQPFIMPRVMDDGTYKDSGHHGLDIGFIVRGKQLFTGTQVLSALDGKIASIIHDRPPYGDMIMVETPYNKIPPKVISLHKIQPNESLYILYAHMQNMQPLEIGQPVHCGQQLAETGLTGATGGPHLHFETRWGPAGAVFPLMAFYLSGVTAEEMDYYTLWRMSGKFKLFDPFDLLNP